MTETAPRLTLLPAVDVADGQAVRLTQGAAGSETSYGEPLDAAEAWIAEEERMLKDAAGTLRIAPAELPGRIAAMMEERKKLENEISALRKKLATGGAGAGNGAAASKTISGITFSGRVLEDVPGKDLKGIADRIVAAAAKLGAELRG